MVKLESDYVLLADTKSFVTKLLQQQGVSRELRAAWEEFYGRYNPLVERYARNCGVPPHEIADAIQNAWIAIVKSLPSFECNPSRGRFRTWLYFLVRRTIVDQFRRDERMVDIDDTVRLDDLPSQELEPVEVFELQWDETVLQQALADFQKYESEQNFQLFYLRRFCQLPIGELAEDSGLSPAVVRQRIHRTSQSFDQLLKRFGYLHLMFSCPPDPDAADLQPAS